MLEGLRSMMSAETERGRGGFRARTRCRRWRRCALPQNSLTECAVVYFEVPQVDTQIVGGDEGLTIAVQRHGIDVIGVGVGVRRAAASQPPPNPTPSTRGSRSGIAAEDAVLLSPAPFKFIGVTVRSLLFEIFHNLMVLSAEG